ncbi:hypothetical protein [Azospirillum argentinense]|uniref:Uncharacterized protein n=1 Tax=Azospirillum argentinense TaxID=2970906 RepID=A0A5B0KPG4_9PROT|nr:hypothetical protein [Azospirillum argentinense]KAA1053845.1 hypothetical protein FH063_002427 [Azospirillum argentinense]
MPPSLFVEAARLAGVVAFGEQAEFGCGRGAGNCERHPAMRLLADWWTATAPQELRGAAFAAPFAYSDGQYLVAAGYKPSILDQVVKAITRKPTKA